MVGNKKKKKQGKGRAPPQYRKNGEERKPSTKNKKGLRPP
jgi:hypothetical protein